MRRFWELEEPWQGNDEYSPKEKEIWKRSINSMTWNEGHYEVSLPWKSETIKINGDIRMAEKRLNSLRLRFSKDKALEKEYTEVISEYINKGYVRRLTEEEKLETRWWVPHFPVIRRDKETTKVRVVFDAAAKVQDTSLNDQLETGPKLQRNIIDVLLRFRKYKVALASDVSEMYMQVKVKSEDRKHLRFLWWEGNELVTYEMGRVMFGLNAAPFLAQLVVQEGSKRWLEEYPRAVETVTSSTYMDDSLDSVPTDEMAINLRSQLEKVWSSLGMTRGKWLTNSTK